MWTFGQRLLLTDRCFPPYTRLWIQSPARDKQAPVTWPSLCLAAQIVAQAVCSLRMVLECPFLVHTHCQVTCTLAFAPAVFACSSYGWDDSYICVCYVYIYVHILYKSHVYVIYTHISISHMFTHTHTHKHNTLGSNFFCWLYICKISPCWTLGCCQFGATVEKILMKSQTSLLPDVYTCFSWLYT
jgi:hypothetical protein